MSVCACGNTMLKGEPWCKRCWAFWSAWYVRTGGKWLTEEGLWACSDARVSPCVCRECERHRLLTHGADVEEDVARVRYDAARPR